MSKIENGFVPAKAGDTIGMRKWNVVISAKGARERNAHQTRAVAGDPTVIELLASGGTFDTPSTLFKAIAQDKQQYPSRQGLDPAVVTHYRLGLRSKKYKEISRAESEEKK